MLPRAKATTNPSAMAARSATRRTRSPTVSTGCVSRCRRSRLVASQNSHSAPNPSAAKVATNPRMRSGLRSPSLARKTSAACMNCSGMSGMTSTIPAMCSRTASTCDDIICCGGFESGFVSLRGQGVAFFLLREPNLHLGIGQQIEQRLDFGRRRGFGRGLCRFGRKGRGAGGIGRMQHRSAAQQRHDANGSAQYEPHDSSPCLNRPARCGF